MEMFIQYILYRIGKWIKGATFQKINLKNRPLCNGVIESIKIASANFDKLTRKMRKSNKLESYLSQFTLIKLQF